MSEPGANHAEVEGVLEDLLAGLRGALDETLEAVHLHGSLVVGDDFLPEASDVDLAVVVRSEIDERQLGRLRAMHGALTERHPAWRDRIDVVYVSTSALRGFRQRGHPLVVVTPGAPLHRSRTDPGWLMTWHPLREHGVALEGPAPTTLIPPTTQEEFLEAVRGHLLAMPDRVAASPSAGFRAYGVLTVCRGLCTLLEGRPASKTTAARWAAARHPAWADVIESALERRRTRGAGAGDDPGPERDLAFVRFGVGQLPRRAGA